MEFTVSKTDLVRELNLSQGVVEKKTTIPILSNVLIEAAKSGLRLTATDLDIQIVEALHSDVLRAGSATAPAHMLYDIVRKMPDGSQVHVVRGLHICLLAARTEPVPPEAVLPTYIRAPDARPASP